ncbi:MAG: hypothetical protein IPL62_02580 [Caulobacteraceae bacterium]|nr:hypothetical protein [Caulobacteraceae bacterium]
MVEAAKIEAREPVWRARVFEAAPHVAAALAFAAGAFTWGAVATAAWPAMRGLDAPGASSKSCLNSPQASQASR